MLPYSNDQDVENKIAALTALRMVFFKLIEAGVCLYEFELRDSGAMVVKLPKAGTKESYCLIYPPYSKQDRALEISIRDNVREEPPYMLALSAYAAVGSDARYIVSAGSFDDLARQFKEFIAWCARYDLNGGEHGEADPAEEEFYASINPRFQGAKKLMEEVLCDLASDITSDKPIHKIAASLYRQP